MRTAEVAGSIHGESGMDGPRLREPTVDLDPRHAVDLIVDTVLAHAPGEITLVPVGPLTNIALAARKEPRIVERVREVVLMGGSYRAGNRSPVNEPWPVTMVGLDLTHQALAIAEVVEQVRRVGTTPARFVLDLFDFFTASYRQDQGFASPPVHDPCAVAYVIDQQVMTVRKAPVDVELTGTLTLGMTVADLRAPAPPDCHTQVAVTLDHERFWALVVDALERIGEVAS